MEGMLNSNNQIPNFKRSQLPSVQTNRTGNHSSSHGIQTFQATVTPVCEGTDIGSRSFLTHAENPTSDRQLLDLLGAFIDLEQFGRPVETFDGIITDVAVSAVKLQAPHPRPSRQHCRPTTLPWQRVGYWGFPGRDSRQAF